MYLVIVTSITPNPYFKEFYWGISKIYRIAGNFDGGNIDGFDT